MDFFLLGFWQILRTLLCGQLFQQQKEADEKANHSTGFLCLKGQHCLFTNVITNLRVFIQCHFLRKLPIPTGEGSRAFVFVRASCLVRRKEIGKLCRKQGSFQLACKKFTQASRLFFCFFLLEFEESFRVLQWFLDFLFVLEEFV